MATKRKKDDFMTSRKEVFGQVTMTGPAVEKLEERAEAAPMTEGRWVWLTKDVVPLAEALGERIPDGVHKMPGERPFKCPACEGTGRVLDPPFPPGAASMAEVLAPVPTLYRCPACWGSGVLWGK